MTCRNRSCNRTCYRAKVSMNACCPMVSFILYVCFLHLTISPMPGFQTCACPHVLRILCTISLVNYPNYCLNLTVPLFFICSLSNFCSALRQTLSLSPKATTFVLSLLCENAQIFRLICNPPMRIKKRARNADHSSTAIKR